jgi:hypothetical protein
MEFLRWQLLRVAGPLRDIARNESAGPIPLAAAHAADGLQQLLHVIAEGQTPALERARELPRELGAARDCLVNAIDNIDILDQLITTALDAHSRS